MENYVSFLLVMRERENAVSRYYKRKMRYCTKEDYTSRGLKVDESFYKVVKNRICPDIDNSVNKYMIKNGYSNETLRNSFSIEVHKCIPSLNPNCKSDSEINWFLQSIYFTLFTLTERVSYLNKEPNQNGIIEPMIS